MPCTISYAHFMKYGRTELIYTTSKGLYELYGKYCYPHYKCNEQYLNLVERIAGIKFMILILIK